MLRTMGRMGGRMGGGMRGHVAAASGRNGTAADIYSFAGTRFKQNVSVQTVPATYSYQVIESEFGTPDWETSELAFFFPTFYSLTTGATSHEIATTSTVIISGVSVFNGSSWATGSIVGGPITIDPATDTAGKWIEVTFGTAIPANQLVKLRFISQVQDGLTVAATGLLTGTERGMGFTSKAAADAYLTNGTQLSNANRAMCSPIACMAKGGDGRPSSLIIGDSIGYGVDATTSTLSATARNEIGYVQTGLDDNAATKRLPYLNMCVPGQKAQTWATSANIAKKLAILSQAVTLNGDISPCDQIISQHAHNDLGAANLSTMLGYYRDMYALFRAALGDAAMPVIQIEGLCNSTSSNNFADLAGQTPVNAANTYPSGLLWQFNEAAGGADGLGDAAATLRADGSIQDSIGAWRYGSYDTGSNRDKWKVLPFASTMAAAWSSGSPSLAAAPAIGDYLSFANGQERGLVTGVSGSGPYTATMAMFTGAISPTVASGSAVNAVMSGDGVHPGSYAHKNVLHQSIIDWKTARGHV